MASNIIQVDGAHEDRHTCTGNITSGALLIHNNRASVALESGTTGQVISVMVGCAAVLTKKAAASTNVTVGGPVTYTATGGINAVHGSTATASVIIGYGLEAATTAATSAKVRLEPGHIARLG